MVSNSPVDMLSDLVALVCSRARSANQTLAHTDLGLGLFPGDEVSALQSGAGIDLAKQIATDLVTMEDPLLVGEAGSDKHREHTDSSEAFKSFVPAGHPGSLTTYALLKEASTPPHKLSRPGSQHNFQHKGTCKPYDGKQSHVHLAMRFLVSISSRGMIVSEIT